MKSEFDGVYWDSSALIKRYIDEGGSETTRALFDDNTRHFTSVITHAEVLCTFYRLKREGIITNIELEYLSKSFLQDWIQLAKVNYDESVQGSAAKLVTISSLRGADLVHLSSCAALNTSGLKLIFATFDKRLANAATDNDLSVVSV